MRTPLYQLDAFTTTRFHGNPAAVMPMETFPDNDILQNIAAENNLAETAFLVPNGEDFFLRWFTPAAEVALCGHATLASAAVVMERLHPDRTQVIFHTQSGPLTVRREQTRYIMNFPTWPATPIPTPPALAQALGVQPLETFQNSFNYMAVLESAEVLCDLKPDMTALARLDRPGISVTAKGVGVFDFISRYFAPAKGIPEDPVTGSAHCILAPYWAEKLHKTHFRAYQASPRGGEVVCRLLGDRVELEGSCVFYLEGFAEWT